MNFLSHYLLDAAWISDEALLGTLLVDIARLRGKGFRLKAWAEGKGVEDLEEVRLGILRHYEVDAWWHNSQIFHNLTGLLKQSIAAPGLPPLPRDYFFAHIAAEMLLDRVAMLADFASIRDYYARLDRVTKSISIKEVLTLSGNLEWLPAVERELEGFLSSRFLMQYVNDDYFVPTVFGVYSRTIGLPCPDAVRAHFEAGLPGLEARFREVVRDSGLLGV